MKERIEALQERLFFAKKSWETTKTIWFILFGVPLIIFLGFVLGALASPTVSIPWGFLFVVGLAFVMYRYVCNSLATFEMLSEVIEILAEEARKRSDPIPQDEA